MTYIYDVILNFQKDYYEFYEWDTNDKIYHIKKIYLVKIDSNSFNDILNNKIKLSDELMLDIFNKCEYFDNKKLLTIPYAIIVTDSYRVMGIMMNMDGLIIKYSSLLLDEEEDILEISNRLATVKIDYKIIKKKINNNLTRNEKNILQYIRKDLNDTYKEKNINKLKFLYYEIFNKQSNDIDEIYDSLIEILNKKIDERHYNLYDLIRLSLTQKSV